MPDADVDVEMRAAGAATATAAAASTAPSDDDGEDGTGEDEEDGEDVDDEDEDEEERTAPAPVEEPPAPAPVSAFPGNPNQLTLLFQGEIYVFESVTPDKVSPSIHFVLFCNSRVKCAAPESMRSSQKFDVLSEFIRD
jgi:hypothetical protein